MATVQVEVIDSGMGITNGLKGGFPNAYTKPSVTHPSLKVRSYYHTLISNQFIDNFVTYINQETTQFKNKLISHEDYSFITFKFRLIDL